MYRCKHIIHDVFVIASAVQVGDGSVRTSIVHKNLHPQWDETFGFHLDPPGKNPKQTTLTVLVTCDIVQLHVLAATHVAPNSHSRTWSVMSVEV